MLLLNFLLIVATDTDERVPLTSGYTHCTYNKPSKCATIGWITAGTLAVTWILIGTIPPQIYKQNVKTSLSNLPPERLFNELLGPVPKSGIQKTPNRSEDFPTAIQIIWEKNVDDHIPDRRDYKLYTKEIGDNYVTVLYRNMMNFTKTVQFTAYLIARNLNGG